MSNKVSIDQIKAAAKAVIATVNAKFRVESDKEMDKEFTDHLEAFIVDEFQQRFLSTSDVAEEVDTVKQAVETAENSKKKFVKAPKIPKMSNAVASTESAEGSTEENNSTDGSVEPVVEKEKKPRKKSAYSFFVKEQMPLLSNTPAKDRMKTLSALWKKLEDKSVYEEMTIVP